LAGEFTLCSFVRAARLVFSLGQIFNMKTLLLSQDLQSLFDALQDMIGVVDEKGRVLYSNPMVSKRLGYSSAELSNMSVVDLHPPDKHQEALDVFSKIIAGRASLCAIPFLAKNGTQIPMKTIVTRGKWGDADAIFGVSRELSGRHNAGLALHESKSRLRAIFDNAAVGLVLGDMSGVITEVNGTLTEMLGYTTSEFIGKSYVEFTHSDDLDVVSSSMGELLGGKQDRVLFEKRFVHKNGSTVWGRLNASLLRDADGEPCYYVVIVENITDRKFTETRLQKNEALLRDLFGNMPDHVYVVDENAIIVYANHDPPGLNKENMVGLEGFGFIDPADQPKCREAFARAVATNSVQRVDCIDIFKQFWSCALVPFVDEGEIQWVMVICTDITEQRKAAVAIRNEQQLLRRIIDVHERDRQVTAYEIHDGVSQQITAALFHLEAFQRMRDSDAPAGEKSLESALKLLSQCVSETRRLISGLRPLILDEYGIIEAIEYLVCENRERSGVQINFHHELNFDRLIPPLENAVFRIVQESIFNACRHSRSNVVFVELFDRGDLLHINIRDSGVGFDPKLIDDSHFGLRSICERARLLGGQARIETTPGSGTCISVDLPVVLRAKEQTESPA
jgi:PAS domain S-box-containing protein